MNPAAEIFLVWQRELRRSFRSVKGVLLTLFAVLGGLGVTMLAYWVFTKIIAGNLAEAGINVAYGSPEWQDLKKKGLEKALGAEQGAFFAQMPEALLAMFQITVWLTPLLVALMSFDAISAEMQHRTLRYWSVRCRKESLFLGKALGQWSVVAIVWLILDLVVVILTVARGQGSIGTCLSFGIRLWLFTLPTALVWSAWATFVSSFFKSPPLALFSILGLFFVLFVARAVNTLMVAAEVVSVRPFAYLYPNEYSDMMLSVRAGEFMKGLLPCLGYAAVLLGLGSWVFRRREV